MRCTRRPGNGWTSCTCPPCRTRNAALSRRYRTLRALGQAPANRSDEALAHLQRLLDAGWLPSTVATAAGVQHTTIGVIARDLRNGRTHTLRRKTSDRILSVNPDRLPDQGVTLVPAGGARRRLQALAALGWALDDVAPRLGMRETGVSRLRRDDGQERTSATIAAAVTALYAELCMTPGPSARARREAAAKGWAPPLAYDDIDTDARPHGSTATDPSLIDQAAVERTLAGDRVPLTRPERVEVIRRLASRGLSDAEMGAVVGITGRSVKRIRDEFGIDTGWVAA